MAVEVSAFFSAKVPPNPQQLSAFGNSVSRMPSTALSSRTGLSPTCSIRRLWQVGDKPVRLLRAVEGIRLTELPNAESCCGFGGTFALKNADTSTAMLSDKMAEVKATGAEVLTAGDYSCLMHIGGGLSRTRAGVRTCLLYT